MTRPAWIALVGVLLTPIGVAADPEGNPPPANASAPEPGARTREWLDQQRSGAAAARARGLPAEAVQRAQRRMLESFSHPIPDTYESASTPGQD